MWHVALYIPPIVHKLPRHITKYFRFEMLIILPEEAPKTKNYAILGVLSRKYAYASYPF